jgi:hypothetical protein
MPPLKITGGNFQTSAEGSTEVAVEAAEEATEEAAFNQEEAADVATIPVEAARRPFSNFGLRSSKKLEGKADDKCVLS